MYIVNCHESHYVGVLDNPPFSGVKIPFVSQERRGFKSSNLTDIFLLVSLKTC